ncbi:MAG: radical SAM protein [Bacteroidetes bacterium]|nr:radical SAM protein [Bacteroidota bacterium]
MIPKVFLFTPPFTQLNTPYPATAYLKGFLNTKNIDCAQADLGIEVILSIFSKSGLKHLFSLESGVEKTDNSLRIHSLQEEYIQTIDIAIEFLQGKCPNFAYQIAGRRFLPEASRFKHVEDLQWAFGTLGLQDKAKYIATLYLEDIADYIKECIDEHFGFSRYAERLGRCAHSFDELYEALHQKPTYIDEILFEQIARHLNTQKPDLVCISVPFPGNVYSAFRAAQYIKQYDSSIRIAMGGGFANTELRSLSDARVFEFFDFITLDDGEAPLIHILEYLAAKRPIDLLKRTFVLINNEVQYINNSLEPDYKQNQLGTPFYADLPLNRYISAVEIINPMHKLWSDGRWNKLTMAHGCYWGKCTFCDISLDYIQRYEPLTAAYLCDQVEQIIAETNERSFHFVDEAAPPSLMKAFALELIKRRIKISWWTNIRFEKSFTEDLCYLLKYSGCIAVSGGLEVASDRLLSLIEKGVSVEGVTTVAHNFSKAGILVHAYLMYGFPSQSTQETIDSMEVVRQMFEVGILQSGFWHQFALTTHSPVGIHPEKFHIKKKSEMVGAFANNDLDYIDERGTAPEKFSHGLKVSLFNYMQSSGFDIPLQKWFDFKIPSPSVDKNFIQQIIETNETLLLPSNQKLYWLGNTPTGKEFTKSKKGNSWEMIEITIQNVSETISFALNQNQGHWLLKTLQGMQGSEQSSTTLQIIKQDYEQQNFEEDFDLFWYNKVLKYLKGKGLIAV